ncbi:hypothetical protein HPB52_004198 [Rhipicephalus sanguineus]|uniref:Uncharacterized protein n=1 Tax=Rhipicephalus sanguineus TaxID=34632 RepID=A0A9D4QH61_RHISA|nr:hypothetical protein HPB52_004198 [Rhipicephalus sanguineus]
MASLRGTRVLIKGLPKATTREFVYYNTASFASIDDVIIASDEDGASAEIMGGIAAPFVPPSSIAHHMNKSKTLHHAGF